MPLELYCIRHGESTANRAGVLAGRGDWELTSRGREQAGETAAVLNALRVRPVRIYTSPLDRARVFAELLERELEADSEVVREPLLNEIDMGDMTGSDRDSALGGSGGRELKDLLDFTPCGGEGYKDIRDRAASFFSKLLERHFDPRDRLFPIGPVLAVGHGGMLTQIATERSSYYRPRLTFFKLDNAEILKLLVEQRYGKVIARLDFQLDPELAKKLAERLSD